MIKNNILVLDVGGKRIGMAVGDSEIKIPRILPTIEVTNNVFEVIGDVITYEGVDAIVVGYPRNLSGDTTQQTKVIEAFTADLQNHIDIPVTYQDESLTSVRAEELLRARNKPYTKADIDAEAAAIILSDYLQKL